MQKDECDQLAELDKQKGTTQKEFNIFTQYFAIRSDHAGKVLDVSKREGPTRYNLIVWKYWKGHNQQFRFISDGTDKFIVNREGIYLTVKNNSKEHHAQVIGAPKNGQAGQRFRLQPVSEGSSYFFIITHCGKALDYFQWGNKKGMVVQTNRNEQQCQKWKFIDPTICMTV